MNLVIRAKIWHGSTDRKAGPQGRDGGSTPRDPKRRRNPVTSLHSRPSATRFDATARSGARALRSALPLLLALLTGCASLEAVNEPLPGQVDRSHGYRPTDPSQYREVGDVMLFVAFSGGGTRAAAFAYGVMQELRDTQIGSGDESRRLLDDVDGISGVSGGSFPAAYYGLFGDRIFDEFEERFLRKNVQGALAWRILAPWNLVRLPSPNVSRTQIARDYYSKYVFEHKTFADLAKETERPRIHVNSTDLVQGNRFSFDQNTFDIICSDLDPFPISAATAASSAVPGVLSPLVLKNYAGQCGYEPPEWYEEALKNRRTNPRGAHVAGQFSAYLDPETKEYIHLVDGGVADNLGMTVVLERLAETGSLERYQESMEFELPDHVIVIVVDAEVAASDKFNMKAVSPGFAATMGLMSGIQINRANFETLDLTQRALKMIGKSLSKAKGHPVTAHMVEVSFDLSDTQEERDYLEHLPTSFRLKEEQVDRLISAGRNILRESPDFQAALEALR
jgi:NTE family protein